MEHAVVHEHISDDGPWPGHDFINLSRQNEPVEYIVVERNLAQTRQVVGDVNELKNTEHQGEYRDHHN